MRRSGDGEGEGVGPYQAAVFHDPFPVGQLPPDVVGDGDMPGQGRGAKPGDDQVEQGRNPAVTELGVGGHRLEGRSKVRSSKVGWPQEWFWIFGDFGIE